MKIYFFGADYPPTGGGIATYSYEWIQSTAMHDEVEVIEVLIFGNRNPRSESLGKKVAVITLRNIGFLYVGYKVFSSFWKNRDYDIFHSFNLFPVGFWVTFWGKIFRKKTCVAFYGTDACDTSASVKTFLLKKWTLRNVSLPITISDFTKRATEKRYSLGSDRIKVIYPVVPQALLFGTKSAEEDREIFKIKKTYNISDNTFVIISVCRLVKRKGVEYLIRAVAEIRDKDIRLLIIGDGPEKDNLINLVNILDIRDRVFILGKVKDIIPFYRIGSVSTLVSYNLVDDGDFEGLGLVLLEAQSYGVPVIGTRSGGVPEAFEENTTGLLVFPQDVKALENAVRMMIDDREMRDRLAENTHSFLERRFGFKNTICRYIELCKSL